MSAEPVAEPAVDLREMVEAAHRAINEALTDEDGYRISPMCEQAPDLWFPEVGDSAMHVKASCGGCPALRACGIYAILAGHEIGIWGGESGLGRGGLEVRLARYSTWISEP